MTWARGFGATLGVGTTDSVVTTYTVNHTGAMSYAIWVLKNGAGGSSLGRMFTKQTATQVLQFVNNSGDDHYRFRQERATNPGEWDITVLPVIGAWEHIVITYDATLTTNDPIMYKNGISTPITETQVPNGAVTSNADAWVLGNRTNDNARNWDGMLAEFAIWNRLLEPHEAFGMGAQLKTPLWYPTGLQFYVSDGLNTEWHGPGIGRGRNTSSTATLLKPHGLQLIDPPWLQGGRLVA